MTTAKKMSRREMLRSFLRRNDDCAPEESLPEKEAGGAPRAEPDYLSSLPPEFSGAFLRAEVARLGGEPDKMTPNEMAGLILRAMQEQRDK